MAALDETVPRFVPTRRDKLRSSTDDFKKHFLMYCMFLGSTHLQKYSGDASSTRVATGDSGATCIIVASNVRLLHLVQKILKVILTTRACCIAQEGSRTLRTKQGFLEGGHYLCVQSIHNTEKFPGFLSCIISLVSLLLAAYSNGNHHTS